MKKRFIAVLLAVLLLLSVLPFQAVAALRDLPAVTADADYDGIPDQYDSAPNDNSFHGSYKSGDFSVNLNYTMDYREFFGDNTAYNQTIADFSTWAAQFTYENDDGGTYYNPSVALRDSDGSSITKVTHIDQLMRAHGMENVIDYKLEYGYFDDDVSLAAYSDDDITEVYFGHHEVTYNGETIEVVAVYVRGTNGTEKEWCSNFDVGDLNRFGDEYDCVEGKSPRQLNYDWMRKSNHRGFDICSNRVRRALELYETTYLDEDATPVYWLAGHSRGGAIANIISSYLVDENQKVFAYTFASPNTTANTEASAAKYDCIFNLVNGDDFVPMLPMPEWGFTRYGRTNTIDAHTASNNQRSNYLGSTSYSYSSDLQSLVNKFVDMTKNNNGQIEGWRDVYVYHCCNEGGSTASYHHHEGETIGEYRSDTWMDFYTDSNWNGYNEHTKKYSYCVKDNNGWWNKYACCQTPAYAMQILAITMGNLGLSAGWDFLTSYKLADKFDFGKTGLITNYATKIVDPHYMENYYLIQKLSEEQGNEDSQYTHSTNLYTENGSPVHTHTYTFYYYDGMEPTCTQEGEGYEVCNCSQINAAWYDDVVSHIKVPALGHEMTYEYVGASMHAVRCGRCNENFGSEACTYADNVCTVCGHVKAASRVVSVYVVDELDGESLWAWAWGDAGNQDAAWPGHALNALGVDKSGHPYYSIDLDIADYDKLILNRNGQPQTVTLDILADAGANDYVVYYIYGASGSDLLISQGTDIWPGPGTVTEPTCTAPGYTTYYGMFTGQLVTGSEVPALGHDYEAVVVEPTCTVGGYTVHTCSRCGDVWLDAETEALGHLPGEPVQENYVEPTATTDGGYDTVVYCQRCGFEISREHTTLPATGPVEPIETTDLRVFLAVNASIEMDVTMTCRKADVQGYERFWFEVVKHALDGDETYTYDKDFIESVASWQAKFRNIFAKEMGVEIEVRLYAEDASGQIYVGPAASTTIRQYLLGRLTSTANLPDTQRTMCADMLNYGAAAQMFLDHDTDHLVNEDLTPEQEAKLHQYETSTLPPAAKTNNNYKPEGQEYKLFLSVLLQNRIILELKVKADENSEVKILMKDHQTGGVVKTLDPEYNGSYHVIRYTELSAKAMRTEYEFVAQIDGEETGNIYTWSLEGYVGEIRNGDLPLKTAVANALLAYGDAVYAHFGDSGTNHST